jgi:iron(III) transport system permease protein
MALVNGKTLTEARPILAGLLNRRPSLETVGGAVLLGIVALAVGYPVVLLFINSFTVGAPGEVATWGVENWVQAFGDWSLAEAFGYTFSLAATRMAIAITLALFFAWIVTRTDMPCKEFVETSLWLGFFLPILPMTLGWILLLDPSFGIVNKFATEILGFSSAPFNVFSYWGIVWCHLAFSVSIRFLLLTPAFRAMDAALEEAARMSGSNSMATVLRINIPILAPAILASLALGFIKSLESFEIEWLLGNIAGISVVSTRIYDFLHWEPPYYGRATALSSVFLGCVFLLIWLQSVMLRGRDYTTLSGRGFTTRPVQLGRWRWPLFALCLLFIVVMIFLPLATLLMGTFMNVFGFFDLEKTWTTDHWRHAFGDNLFMSSLKNTLVLAVGATLAGVLFYAVVSYVIVRSSFFGRSALNFFSWLPWALPGVLLSLALLWVVLGTGPIVKLAYGTTMILMVAIIVKEMPLGTQMMKTGTMQISRELEESSRMSGATWGMTFRRVMLPLLRPSVISVGIVVFIISVREISAIVFLSSYQSRTLSLLMMDYIADQRMESATVIGVFIVALILGLLFLGRLFGLRPGGMHH